MKILKIIFRILLALVILAAIGLLIFRQTLKPTYDGQISLSGTEKEVEVYFDTYGIPHIYASNETDAFRALGYVHAQDRLWQMELLRRVGGGGLSEVFGKDLLPTDKLFLALGIDESSEEAVKALDLDSQSVQLATAYLEGVNEFIENGPTPIEYYLTGLDKTPFSLKDIHNAIGYMAFSFAQGLKAEPLLTNIRSTLGPEYIADLAVDLDSTTEWIKNYNTRIESSGNIDLTVAVHNALDKLPVPQFIGSNSWVLGPEKTENGAVILANDPHIGFAQPSVWYEAHIVTPTYEKYGYHLAGIPFPLLGHDRHLAYGLTMFENDDTEFYFEEIDPSDNSQYMTAEGYRSFDTVSHKIKVKDSSEVDFQYRKTVHGPLLNGIAKELEDDRPVSLAWTYTKFPNQLLESLFQISHAEDISEFRAALPILHAPGLNVMYGDAKGNVAWWASAKLHQMPEGVSTKFILDGSSGLHEPLRYLDFDENPQAVNPPWNYVYSANNQPDSIAGILYPGYYLPENRAKRIVDLLESKEKWNREEVGQMVNDVVSPVNHDIVHELYPLVEVENLNASSAMQLDMLEGWSGQAELNLTAPTLFHRWIYFILKNTFADELQEERFEQFLKTDFHKRLIAPLIANPESVWWDDVSTTEITETRREIINRALGEALESLREDLGPDVNEWTWDKVHTLEHQHPIGQIDALRSFFNVGPFPVKGTREVINNMAFPYDGTSEFNVTSGPSTRRVIDFSDIENAQSILPTGQSGNPFSEHYEDQARMYNRGEYRKMMMNKEEIMSTFKSLLIFGAH